MSDVLIVGHGVVGKNLEKELYLLKPDIADKYKPEDNTYNENAKYKLIFICVPTPATDEDYCDISAVKDAIKEYQHLLDYDGIIVIKSTILPGTTEKLMKDFDVDIVFSPEYYGGTVNNNTYDFNFTIIGTMTTYAGHKVQQILQRAYDARHIFRIVDADAAEIVKYMENAWLATKVSFCSEFYRIVNTFNVSPYYEELRELFVLDPRVNPSHTFIFDDHPYWDSHCLNKDVKAIAEHFDSDFLRNIIKHNEMMKEMRGN